MDGCVDRTCSDDPILIDANTFAEPDDVKAAIRCVELCREIGNADRCVPSSAAR